METTVITLLVLIGFTFLIIAMAEKGISPNDIIKLFKTKSESEKSIHTQKILREKINQVEREIQAREFELSKSELERKFLVDKLVGLQGKLLIEQQENKQQIENPPLGQSSQREGVN